MADEAGGDDGVAVDGRQVEGRPALAVQGVGVGLLLQQQQHGVRPVARHHQVQQRRALSPRGHLRRVGAVVDEHLGGEEGVVVEGHVQGRGPLGVARVHVHPALKHGPQGAQLLALGQQVHDGVAAAQDGRAQLLHLVLAQLVQHRRRLVREEGGG